MFINFNEMMGLYQRPYQVLTKTLQHFQPFVRNGSNGLHLDLQEDTDSTSSDSNATRCLINGTSSYTSSSSKNSKKSFFFSFFYELNYWVYFPCFFSFLYFTLALIITGFSNANANNRRPMDGKILRDISFEFLPVIRNNELPNKLTHLLCIISLVVLFVHSRGLTLLRRTFFIWANLLLIRCTTVSVTNLPDPNPQCIENMLVNDINSFVNGVTCGDMIFSGHTVAILMCVFTIRRAFKPFWIHMVLWIYTFIGLFVLLLTRFHYTVDIILGIYISVSFWIIYHYVFCTEPMIANVKFLEWFEQDRHHVSTMFGSHKWDIFESNIDGYVHRIYQNHLFRHQHDHTKRQ